MTKLIYIVHPTYPKKLSRAVSINYNGSPIQKRCFNKIVSNIKNNNTKLKNKELLCSDDYFECYKNIVTDDSKTCD